jgi:hypothetical protein
VFKRLNKAGVVLMQAVPKLVGLPSGSGRDLAGLGKLGQAAKRLSFMQQ